MKYRNMFSCFLIFSLLLDSGGQLGLQYVSVFLLASIVLVGGVMNQIKVDPSFYEFFLLVLIIYSLFFLGVLVNDTEVNIFYSAFLFFLIISYGFTSLWGVGQLKNSYVWASIIFLFLYMIVHLLLIFYSSPEQIVALLEENVAGRFHEKIFFGYEYFVIYPQSLLFITGASVVLFLRRRYLLYVMMLLFFLISTSRFGLFVSLLVPILCYALGVRAAARLFTLTFPFLIFILFLCYFFVYFYFKGGFSPDYYHGLSSFEARVGQLISTIDSFSDLSEILFGQGAGSEFYSLRSLSFVDNSELSQLEFVRKYGLFSFIVFHALIFRSLYLCYVSNKYEEVIVIFTVYFTTFSNPVLTSLFVAMIVVYGYVSRGDRECSNYSQI